jgi:PAS domain S-box-containing protein
MGVRSDWPELRSIIDKAFDAMPEDERTAIINKWTTLRVEHGIRSSDVLRWALGAAGVAALVALLLVTWNRQLTRSVGKRTAELKESEGRFRATFEQAAVGIAHVAPDGRFLRVNRRFCDIVGYSHDEMMPRTFQDITHPADLDADLKHVRQLLAGEADTYSMEKRYIRKDGETVWVSLTVSLARDAEGAPRWFVSVVEDISARKRVERALRESEGKFRQLMEQSPVSIQLMSPDGRVTAVNRAWMDLWGIPKDDLPEVLAKYNILEDKEARKRGVMPLIEKAFKGEAVLLPVIEYEAADTMDDLGIGTEANKVWLQVRLYPIRDSEDEVVGVVQMEEDITSRRKAEEQLHAYRERLRALASGLTLAEERARRSIAADLHDHVGQTLALARVRLANARRAASEEKLKAMLDEVSESVLEASRETRHLVFDLGSPSMNEIGLAAAISEWLDERIGDRYGLKTDFVDQAGRVPLTDDIQAILFRNVRELLTNAVKHAHAQTVSVRLERDDGDLRIVIRDDGVGFSPDATDRKVEDTGGFGLFSIEERMADLGGTFEIVSEPGAGCTAVLTAPLSIP